MKPIEHDTAIDWLKQTCAIIREMDAENKKLKEALKEVIENDPKGQMGFKQIAEDALGL